MCGVPEVSGTCGLGQRWQERHDAKERNCLFASSSTSLMWASMAAEDRPRTEKKPFHMNDLNRDSATRRRKIGS
jgi:hypothetical protein